MSINFYIGNKEVKEHLFQIINGYKIAATLSDVPIIHENKDMLYTKEFLYLHLDNYLNKYKLLSTGQKISSIMYYISFNYIKNVYFYNKKLDNEFINMISYYINLDVDVVIYYNNKDDLSDVNINIKKIDISK